ncbi:MAG: sigma-70 family RNA polymerase sigma factor [Gemmataceae bacterium]
MADDAEALKDVLERLARAPQEPAAWRELHRLTAPLVIGMLYRRLGDAAHSEDAAQEVFLRLARYAPFKDLKAPETFRRYLWSVCRNTARDYWRRRLRDAQREVPLSEEPPTGAGSPEEAAQLDESLEVICGRLDPTDRTLLLLVLRGTRLPEIASKLGLSYANAGVRLHRLRRRIQAFLGKP